MSIYDINLFTRKNKSFAEKLLFFLLHYFRYIIVLTQIVVIGVFFYRFKVDQKIIDLKQAFRSKQQILALTAPLIDEALATQETTDKIETILNKQKQFQSLNDAVIGVVPEGIIIIEMELDKSLVVIKGLSDDTFAVQRYYRKLRNTPKFSDVTIEELNINADLQFNFSINLTVAQEPVTEPGTEPAAEQPVTPQP